MRFDQKAPEIESIAWLSSNQGLNDEDFGKSRLVRDGDTLTLEFTTSERISSKEDLEGSRKPSVSFFYGENKGGKELEVTDENITLQTVADTDFIEVTGEGSDNSWAIGKYYRNDSYLEGWWGANPKGWTNGNGGVIALVDNEWLLHREHSGDMYSVEVFNGNTSGPPSEGWTSISDSQPSPFKINHVPNPGTKWRAEIQIDGNEEGLDEQEGYFGFRVTVLDKAGNQRVIEFEDDQQDKSETSLAQKSLDGEGEYETQNPLNFRARLDTRLPEVESINLLSSNPGTNPDYNNDESKTISLLLRDNDTVSLEFITSERISTKDDLDGDQKGSRKPSVSFYSGDEELPVSDENITLQNDNQSGTKWVAHLKIDESVSSLTDNETYLGFKV
ncbi:MAG: hypothetical protein QF675_11905, partial [SAR324 cluster bacterium]|nr:hypothetical protein [SAR324 cluster bacterium]